MKRIRDSKKLKVILLIIVVLLILIVSKVAYSFLGPNIDDGMNIHGNVQGSGHRLTFSKGNDLSLSASIDNFGPGASNLTATTSPTATLEAVNTNSASATYVAGIIIAQNTFQYSTAPTNTPELILSVLDENGNAVTTSSDTLSYVTSGGVSGFDVTNKKGAFNIVINHAISTTSTTTHTWTFTLTFVNLTGDQSINESAKFNAMVVLQQENLSYEVEYASCTNPKITNMYNMVCDDDLLACKVAKEFDYTDIENSKVVLHNGIVLDESSSCAVLDAEDNSYRYTGGDYDVTQTAINAGYSYVNTYYGNTTGGVIGVNCNGTNQYVGYNNSACSTKYYYLLYDTNVTQYATYDEAVSQAITDGYIVSRNLNNYVCFGYDTSVPANATTCPESNLYRIIGAFDDDNDGNYNIKLIKSDYASTTEFGTNAQNGTSSYYSNYTSSQYTGYHGTISSVNGFSWYGTSSNVANRWDNSTFRSGVLNNYYLNTYLNGNDTKWKNMIDETTYYLGGPGKTGYTSFFPKDLYNTERTAEAVYDTTTYPASIDNYIGLMYVSDYGYASKTNTWSISTSNYVRARGNDWIYNGIIEWTITPFSVHTGDTINVNYNGIAYSYSNVSYGRAVRPVMYLDSGVEVLRGLGTKASPYYVGLPT